MSESNTVLLALIAALAPILATLAKEFGTWLEARERQRQQTEEIAQLKAALAVKGKGAAP